MEPLDHFVVRGECEFEELLGLPFIGIAMGFSLT